MDNGLIIATITRRFLQARRRGLFDLAELTSLLHPDAVYREEIDGESWEVRGRQTIAELLHDLWASRGATERMAIVRHRVTGADTAVGHWRRQRGDGSVLHGRDSYTLVDGLIIRVEVEEFDDADVPTPTVGRSSQLTAR